MCRSLDLQGATRRSEAQSEPQFDLTTPPRKVSNVGSVFIYLTWRLRNAPLKRFICKCIISEHICFGHLGKNWLLFFRQMGSRNNSPHMFTKPLCVVQGIEPSTISENSSLFTEIPALSTPLWEKNVFIFYLNSLKLQSEYFCLIWL